MGYYASYGRRYINVLKDSSKLLHTLPMRNRTNARYDATLGDFVTVMPCERPPLRKLEAYGIRGNALKLFESYLKDRYQFVQLDNVKSSISLIEFGVPQGSILGPLLFLIYINDLPEATKLFV